MLTIPKIKPDQFLNWLYNRLKFRYKEEEIILDQIYDILNNYILFPKKIPIDLIDKICQKNYPDFHIDKSSDINIGYTETERLQIRNLILNIIKDIVINSKL